jgi:hypothetical protein
MPHEWERGVYAAAARPAAGLRLWHGRDAGGDQRSNDPAHPAEAAQAQRGGTVSLVLEPGASPHPSALGQTALPEPDG